MVMSESKVQKGLERIITMQYVVRATAVAACTDVNYTILIIMIVST